MSHPASSEPPIPPGDAAPGEAMASCEATAPAAHLLPEMVRMDPAILRYLRQLLRARPVLRLEWETLDFFQELSTRFMMRVAAAPGGADLPDQHATALMRRLARHACIDQLRHIRAKRRDVARRDHREPRHVEVASEQPKPIDRLIAVETLERLRSEISELEWEILRLHGDGFGWVEIGQRLGMKPSAVRMKFTRMAARVAGRL